MLSHLNADSDLDNRTTGGIAGHVIRDIGFDREKERGAESEVCVREY